MVSRIASQSYPASSAFARQALAFVALSGQCRLLKLMEKRLKNVFNTPIRILWPHGGSTTTAMFEEALLSIGLLVVAAKLAEGVLRRRRARFAGADSGIRRPSLGPVGKIDPTADGLPAQMD